MRRSSGRGFSLIELMIVVAIFSILTALAFTRMTKRREMVRTENALERLKSRIVKAQAASMLAGNRLGTLRVAAAAGCESGGHLFVQINPATGAYNFPSRFLAPAANGTLTPVCEPSSIAIDQANQNVQAAFGVVAPAVGGVLSFGFSSSGRLINVQNGPPGSGAAGGVNEIFIPIRDPTVSTRTVFGLRILASGVICETSDNGFCAED